MPQNPMDQQPLPQQEDLEAAMESLSGKSESELFEALKEATQQERDAGNMSNTYMEEIYDKLYPFLSESQRQKMRQVIERLKE